MIVVTGAASGIGEAVASDLTRAHNRVVHGLDVHEGHHVDQVVDLTDQAQVRDAVLAIEGEASPVDGVVYCHGINLLEPVLKLSIADAKHVMDVNMWSHLRLFKMFEATMQPLAHCFVVSDASHKPMTHSLAYNLSKAALHMLVEQLAHEVRDRVIFGVSPSKVSDTAMSQMVDHTVPALRGWTYEDARAYQLSKLQNGEVDKYELAGFISHMIRHQPRSISGCVLPYGK